jgi:hypothetical protein
VLEERKNWRKRQERERTKGSMRERKEGLKGKREGYQ